MNKSPKDFFKYTESMIKNIEIAESKEIAIGLPISGSGTKKIYKSGDVTVLDVGLSHEYGLGNNPVRSFLRVPFEKNKEKIDKALNISFRKIFDGAASIKQMEILGAYVTNFSKDAFRNKGYNTWPEITAQTAERKGSTAILTDTGTLKQSITYVVRNVT